MGIREIKKFCRINEESEQLLKEAVNRLAISARGFHKILKLSRTIADLGQRENIEEKDIAEAIQYRQN